MPIDNFYIRSYKDKNGNIHKYSDSKCKDCKNAYSRNYNNVNKDTLKSIHKEWRDKNKTKVKSYRESGEENIQTTLKNGLKEISLKLDSHRLSIIII